MKPLIMSAGAFCLGAMTGPEIHLVFSNKLSLVAILFSLLGLIAWLTYMAITQRRMLTRFVTKEELREAFETFRKEMRAK